MTTPREHPETPAQGPSRPSPAGPPGVRLELQAGETRMGAGVGLSMVSHVVVALVVIAIIRYAPEPERTAFLPQRSPDAIVWIPQPGPGGGGGGGGEPEPVPATELEIPGEDEIAVPVAEPEEPEVTEPEPLDQSISISALTMNAGDTMRPGQLEAEQASAVVSRGAGLGTGIGEGEGDGLGEGVGGGFGGGAFRPGNGVEPPSLVRSVRPNYTMDAIRAQAQGTVLVECVVRADGTVGEARVVRSFGGNNNFGLDDEALIAARQWVFEPGTRFGEPVATLVTLEIFFSIR